jgi:hypothetical protein
MFAKILQFRVGKIRATVLLLTCAAMFLWGCSSSTFLVSKDCNTYFLGDTEVVFNKMLCASGDFKKILDSSNLPPDVRESLYKAQCVDHSREDVKKIYASLTPEQKRDLKFNFQVHGYYVNYKPVPNYQYDYYAAAYNGEFCYRENEY